jgi:muramoyltetrapeptide carboxypeptidase
MLALPRLRPGDRVRIVSPSSPPDRDGVMRGVELLSSWGLIPEIAAHAFDRHGHYLAGRDEDRLADLNDALRDPGVRAIFTTRGGKGAYRIADRIDFDAAVRDPKPLVGFSDTTILHLALWHRAHVGSVHGPHVEWHGPLGSHAAARLKRALMASAPIVVERDSRDITAAVTSAGTATGTLMGGNLSLIARAVGWTCPSFAGAILVIEDVDKHIGHIDSALTQLPRSGVLDGLRGIAIGQFIRCAEPKPGKWSIVDVLRDRLLPLGVPMLGGLPIGHGSDPHTIPLGTTATIDAAAGTLTVQMDVA